MAIALLTLSFLAQIVYKKNRVCFCVLFFLRRHWARTVEVFLRSQNHSTWTIPALVADRGGYHPHLLLCELTCIWSLFLTMHQSRISMAVVIVCFNVLLANGITPEHISWNLLWDQRSQTNLILHEWNKKTIPELLRYFHSGSKTRAAPRWRACGQPRKGHPRGSCRPEAWGGADWCSLWIL